MTRRAAGRRITFEALESRCMLSVSAELIDTPEPGTLFVKGDRLENVIDLSTLEDGSIQVSSGGVAVGDPFPADDVNLILINTGDSADLVTFGEGDSGTFQVSADVDLDTGKGEDIIRGSLDITGDADIKSGPDRDVIDLTLAVIGNVSLNAGAGDNDLFVDGSVGGNLDIQAGRGEDNICLSDLEIDGDLTLRTSKGKDTVTLQRVSVSGNASLDGGPGDGDTLLATDFIFGSLTTANFETEEINPD